MSGLIPFRRWFGGIQRRRRDSADTRLVSTIRQSPLLKLELLDRADRTRVEAIVRARCATAYLHGTDALCWALGRYRMVVDTADIGLSTYLMLDGFWEMWVTEVIAGLIRPGMTVVDCGANLGYYTLIAADRVGAAGRIHAIEPNPALARRLRRTMTINGFDAITAVHEVALSDAPRDVAFRIPADEPKNGHITYLAAHEVAAHPDCIAVPAVRLDALLGDAPVDFVKIDVEGAEEALWRGMSGILAQGRPLIVLLEFNLGRYADPAAFLDEVAGHGFRLERIDDRLGAQPVTRADVLAGPPIADQMLLLTR